MVSYPRSCLKKVQGLSYLESDDGQVSAVHCSQRRWRGAGGAIHQDGLEGGEGTAWLQQISNFRSQ